MSTCHYDRIQALRHLMAQHQLDAYIAPAGDPHGTEYLHPHFKGRDWLTGFTGSRGTVVITPQAALLWTDGRYFIQAANELKDSSVQLMRIGFPEDPTLAEWLAIKLPSKPRIGFFGMDMPLSEANGILKAFGATPPDFVCDRDLIGALWEDRPLLPTGPARVHPLEFAGTSVDEKLMALRAQLPEGALHLLCKLDDIAWLFNLRGDDIPNNPYCFSFALIDAATATLYIDPLKVTPDVLDHLSSSAVTLRPYSSLLEDLCNHAKGHTYLIEEASTPYQIYTLLKARGVVISDVLPTSKLKSIKSIEEQAHIREAYIQDGIALVKFMRLIKENPSQHTEYTIGPLLTQLRQAGDHARGNSFDTICAYKDHGAMMHYKAAPATAYPLEAKGLLLVDSGGQYLTGTTDITRTIALGPLTQQEKEDYTITLKAMRYLASAIFLKGATGTHLDGLCRHHMWRHGLDYKCGTGHGLGYHLGVHEGPQNFSMNPSSHPIVPGMVVTDEPGVYREGVHGVRIEDTLICTPHLENEFGTFYKFENVTLVPYERDAIVKEMLTQEEVDGINAYHARVYRTLAPHLAGEDLKWLERATKAV